MLFAVPDWTVSEWSAAIGATGAVVGALATVVVAVIVPQLGRAARAPDVTQEINLALRIYNLAALTEPELLTVITGAHPGTVEEMRQARLMRRPQPRSPTATPRRIFPSARS